MNGLIRCAHCGKLMSRGSVEMEFVDGVFICSDCVDEATFICEHCEERHLLRNRLDMPVTTDSGSQTWCVDCASEDAFYCNHCEEYFSNEDYESFDVDGDILCEDCVDDCAFYCEDCCEYHYDSHGRYIEDVERMVCEDCLNWSDNYFRCNDCGEWHWYEDMHRVRGGELVCGGCIDGSYYYCEECDEYVYCDDWNDDAGMCNECARERGVDGVVLYPNARRLNYHDYNRPSLKWFGRALPSWNSRMRGIGLEIECDAPESGMSLDMQSALNDVCAVMGDRVFFEYDCSLNNAVGKGFEMITQPHTVDEFYEVPWAECFEAITRHGWSAHNAGTCGLHVHFSREMFGEDEDTQDDNIAKLIQFFELYYDDIVKVSRRTLDSDGNVHYARKCGYKGKTALKEYAKRKYSDHYSAVNIDNSHTVEIRIMRGTLKVETFMACVDFLLTIVRNSCRIGWSDTTDDFEWLVGLKDTTADYIISRNAFYSAISTLRERDLLTTTPIER